MVILFIVEIDGLIEINPLLYNYVLHKIQCVCIPVTSMETVRTLPGKIGLHQHNLYN